MSTRKISPEEAIKAVRRKGFTVPEGYGDESGRTVIHTFAGPFGADWDVESAVEMIQTAKLIAWDDSHLMGHELLVETSEGRVIRFDCQESAWRDGE